jgi:hypothetical protein
MSEASYQWESPLCIPSLVSACLPARFHELPTYDDREVMLLCKLYESIILGDIIWGENRLLIRDLLYASYVSAPVCNDLSLPFHREKIMPMIGISSPLLNAGSCIVPN